MKRTIGMRLFSVLLSLTMLVGMVPATVFAAETDDTIDSQNNTLGQSEVLSGDPSEDPSKDSSEDPSQDPS